MPSFIGEYEVSIDAKGRFLLPAGLRRQFAEGQGDRFVVNRGFETCLVMYTMEVWNMIADKINRLNDFNPKERQLKRMFLNGAHIVELDGAGRMNLPKNLMEYAGLTKDMVLSAQGNKMELWDKTAHQNYMNEHISSLSDLASEVGGGEAFNPFA